MKILVTGAAGMLANDVIPCLRKRGHEVIATDVQLSGPDIKALDVTDQQKVFKVVERYRPDFVFHLAAATNVDRCQQEPDWAFVTNTLGTENIALACHATGAAMLYISTGSVFNGHKEEPYTEYDQTDPANTYARSKWEGEEIVRTLVPRHFILRAGWMVGGWEVDKKFVYKIAQQVLAGNRTVKAVDDKFGSPTFTWDFAAQLLSVVETRRYGLFHLANRGTASRYEIACRIVEYMDRRDDVDVIPISSDEFPLPAPRARSEMIRNYKLDLLGLNQMPAWEVSLKMYIKKNTVPAASAAGSQGEKIESAG